MRKGGYRVTARECPSKGCGGGVWEVILSHAPLFVLLCVLWGVMGVGLEGVVQLGGLTAYDGGRTSEQRREKAWETFKVSGGAGCRCREGWGSGVGEFEA